MAAGLGFKDFVTGEVLTAADVDGYLMQGVWVFASAAARDAAVTSPQEGNFAYLKDTNVTTYYTGSAWANLDTTGMTNPMTTTGDTIYSSSGSTPARLGIGSTGQVLTVASGLPSWATPAGGGGMTLLSTTTLSGSSTTISSISGAYKSLRIVGKGIEGNATDIQVTCRINGITSGSYTYGGVGDRITGTVALCNEGIDQTSFFVTQTRTTAVGYKDLSHFVLDFPRYSETEYKFYQNESYACNDNANGNRIFWYVNGIWNDTAAITSLTFLTSTSTFSAGTIYIYGVN